MIVLNMISKNRAQHLIITTISILFSIKASDASAYTPSFNAETAYDVVIVGAGLSGLNAARTLHDHAPDQKILVLDARDRLGGLTYTQGGIELGGEFVDRNHHYMLSLLKELKLTTVGVSLNGDIIVRDTASSLRWNTLFCRRTHV